MPVSQGTYTIGGAGSGADYANVESARSDTAFPLTGDLTFEVIASFTEPAPVGLFSGDLGGYSLRFTSRVPHKGRPGSSYIIGANSPQFYVSLNNGTVELDNLEIEASGAGWEDAIDVSKSGTTGTLNIKIHDILVDSNSNSLADNGNAISILLSGGAGGRATLKMWNVIANVLSNDIGATHKGTAATLEISPSIEAGIINVDNCIFRIHGNNQQVYALTVNDDSGIATLTNTVAIAESTYGSPTEVCFDLNTGSNTVQNGCASTDATSSAAAVYSNEYNNITVLNEFDSVDETAFGSYFAPKDSGNMADGGSAVTLVDNIYGIQGTARPHNGDYSIGAVENIKLSFSTGIYTVGTGGNFTDMAAAYAAMQNPLTGDVTLKFLSNVTETGFVVLDAAASTLNLAGNKIRITSDIPHNGDPSEGVTWTIAVDVQNFVCQLMFTGGDIEIDNIIVRHDVTNRYTGLYLSLGTGGEAKIHDLMVFGPSDPLTVIGLYINASGQVIKLWNVIVDAEHTDSPIIGATPQSRSQSLLVNITLSSQVTMENCSILAHAVNSIAANGVAGLFPRCTGGPAADQITLRNVLSIARCDNLGVTTKAYFNSAGPPISFTTGYNCASNDATVDDLQVSNNSYPNIDLSNLVSTDISSLQFYLVPTPTSILGNGTTPQLAENTAGIRGRARTGTGIGSSEPLPVHTGDSPFVTDFVVVPVIEGPQILVTWALPDDSDTTNFKLLKKLLNYSEDQTDGTELVSSPVGSAPSSYVDLNPTPQKAWTYSAFVYHYATTYWTADTLIEAEQTIAPITTTGFFYVSLNRGFTGSSEPTWPTEIGDTVIDGDITWECFSENPSWVGTKKSRGATITWDSEYIQRLLFRAISRVYRNYDAKSNLEYLTSQTDSDYFNVYRAIHEDGTVKRGEFERFLLIFGAALSRVKGAADFYPKLLDPDECVPQYLSYLAGNVGWELNTTLPTAQQRQEILSAVPVYKRKGTADQLEVLLSSTTGVDNVIVDPMSHHILMSNRLTRLSAQGVDGLAYSSWQALTVFARGDIVIPTAINRTGFYYQARTAGTSAASEPAWPTTPGVDVTDGTVTWRCRQFSAPHLTADAAAGASSITVDSTSTFEVGKTVNIRDNTTLEGEEIVISSIPNSITLNFSTTLSNSYTVADDAKVTPAFDWYDDKTGFIWDIPLIDDFAGIDPSRVRVQGEILDPSILYSFEFLRLWFILEAGESVSNVELERIARIMEQFAPADTSYVVRTEQA